MLFCAIAVALSSDSVTIVDHGRSNWSIVDATHDPVVGFAAKELQSYVNQAARANLPIEEKAAKHKSIRLIKDATLAEEEFTIRTDRAGIEIRGGGKRGTLYGCYGFLHDVMGVRWFVRGRDRASVPVVDTLRVSALNIHDRPAFEYREPYFTEAIDQGWDLANRANGTSMPLEESVGGRVSYGRFVHTFAEIVPPETYFKDHPEYFSFSGGKRQGGYAQLCLTNPDVLRITIDKVRSWIKENPTATIFSVSQNDTFFRCECDKCKAIEVEEGAASGPLLRFVNSVATEIGRESPNVLIDTLAYQWSEKPPLHVRPVKNVRIRLAPIDACFSHPLDGCDKNKRSYENLVAWSKITNQLYIWHYCTDFANYLQPLPSIDEIAGDIRLFHKLGVVGVFYEGAYGAGGGGENAELKSYLIAQLLWNPEQPVQPLVTEFLNGVYHAAAPLMQSWLDLIHEPARAHNIHATIYDNPSAPYFSAELLSRGQRLFDAAEYRVRDDATALTAVQRARMALEYLQYLRTPATDPMRKWYGERLAEKIRRFGVGETSEGGSAVEFLKRNKL